eukprot:7543349-Pyramimonas_sp.AAC.1
MSQSGQAGQVASGASAMQASYLMQQVHSDHILEVPLEGHHQLLQPLEVVTVGLNHDHVRLREALLEGHDDLLGHNDLLGAGR